MYNTFNNGDCITDMTLHDTREPITSSFVKNYNVNRSKTCIVLTGSVETNAEETKKSISEWDVFLTQLYLNEFLV